jgi:hypothetical protein
MDGNDRNFWVVSPNVDGRDRAIGKWKQASIRYRAAFMGYPPNDRGFKKIGSKFAHEIKSGDVVLIARRHDRQPEIVGFGVVVGKFKRHIKNFVPPDDKKFSMRELSPFLVREQLPPSLNVMSVLGQTAALRHIRRSTHEKICSWLERQLLSKKNITRGPHRTSVHAKGVRAVSTKAILARMPQDKQLEYITRTRKAVSRTLKLEARLLARYHDWLERQGRTLQTTRTGRLRCDGYEPESGNLIEAKSRAGREYIRMAVGQLFDYAFLSQNLRKVQNLAILVPNRPSHQIMDWLKSLKISVIWQQKGKFKDNAGNRFS